MKMTLHVWSPEGISKSFTITVDDKGKTLHAWPYKWYSVRIINDDDVDLVKVTINDGSIATAREIQAGEHRDFKYDKPTIFQTFLIAETGKSVSVRVETER